MFAALHGALRCLSLGSSYYERAGRNCGNVILADDGRSPPFKDAKHAITAIRRAKCVSNAISFPAYQPGAAGRRASAGGGRSNQSTLHNFSIVCL